MAEQPIALFEPLHPEAESLLATARLLRRGLDAPLGGVCAIVTRGMGRITAAALDAAGPGLRAVARVGAGTDNVDVARATALGLPVFYAPDAFTASTAEHALALLLAAARRLVALDAAVHTGNWAIRLGPPGLDLKGRRLGIIGLGRIGRRTAELAAAFGMEVRAWSRQARDARFPQTELDALLASSDVISLHLALDDATRGFLSAARIAALRPGAIVINVGRGALIDEAALAAALAAGHVRAAGLDTLATEPPPADHPLLHAPNVVLSPHSAALTEGAYRTACVQVAAAVCAHLRGEPADPTLVRNPEVLR